MGKVGKGRAPGDVGCPEINVGHPGICRAAVEVVVKPSRGQGGPRERWLEQVLAGCCECCLLSALHPHTALSIVLQIHTSQGSVREAQQCS